MGILPILALAFCGCQGSKLNPLNQPGITAKPYDGIKKNSYGALSLTPLTYCGDSNNVGEGMIDFGRSVMGEIYKPIGQATVYDDTIIREDLQDKFRSIGNEFLANVVVLNRDQNEIVFWFSADSVSPAEVIGAAEKYCGYRKKKALVQGIAKRCGPSITIPAIVKINGQGSSSTVAPTYVIAGFSCM